jgi:hypothetical protein
MTRCGRYVIRIKGVMSSFVLLYIFGNLVWHGILAHTSTFKRLSRPIQHNLEHVINRASCDL